MARFFETTRARNRGAHVANARKTAAALAACLFGATFAAMPAIAEAGDSKRRTAIECVVSYDHGATGSDSKWIFAQEGVGPNDRIGLFWHPGAEEGSLMRVAIDGPVSKPAHLISITDDSVVAVVMTSDQYTTRSWFFTINFRRQQVLASGASSNPGGIKGQMIPLSCSFDNDRRGKIANSAADSWRRWSAPE